MKNKSIWKYLTIGGIVGVVVGILINISYESLPEFLIYPSIPILFLFSLTYDCSDVSCAIDFIFSLIIAYTILGLLISYLIYKFKK